MEVGNFILDLILPKNCLGCHQPGTFLCPNCLTELRLKQALDHSFLDQAKIRKETFDELVWAVHYSDPLVKKLIKGLKYNYLQELAKPLALLLIDSLPTYWLWRPSQTIIVPVPLHRRKLRERGFNQAELLANLLSKHFNLPLENKAAKRQQYTHSQASLKNSPTRRSTLKRAFVANKDLVEDKIVILIDDVATTDTTLREVARVLRQADALKIYALVVAKG